VEHHTNIPTPLIRFTRRTRHHGHIIRGVIDRDLGAALNNAISPPHQLARQLLDSLAKVSVPAHVEQLIDNIFQRCRINIAAESLRDLAHRVGMFPRLRLLGFRSNAFSEGWFSNVRADDRKSPAVAGRALNGRETAPPG
jgi:hypothetical protein